MANNTEDEEIEIYDFDDDSDDDSQETEEYNDNFEEVLQLTEYVGTDEARSSNVYVQAEYKNIDVVQVNINHQKIAKNIVQKITKFILDFNDVTLNVEHQKYIKSVAELQVSHLSDLLSLTAINKQMLDNMVLRVNSVQAEDYAMLTVYNTLANQHLKFHKELQNTYKNIPSMLRKMRLDVMDPENLLEKASDEGIVVEDSGVTQFNNTKELLKTMKLKQLSKIEEKINNSDTTI